MTETPITFATGKRSILQLIVFVAGVMAFVLGYGAWCESRLEDKDGSTGNLSVMIRDLEAVRPEVILLGDSMLYTRMKPGKLSQISGKSMAFISQGGSSSVTWYLYLKNVILPMKKPPRIVVVFFRNQQLSVPKYRTTGMHESYLEGLMQPSEPLLSSLLDNRKTWFGMFQHAMHKILVQPFETQASAATDRFESLAMDISALGERKAGRNRWMNERFALKNLRHDLPPPAIDSEQNDENDGDKISTFDPSPTVSVLPAMIQMAKENQIRLVFFRVKNRPNRSDVAPQSEEVKTYIAGLRSYLQSQNCALFDESDDLKLTHEMYADGDHLAAEKMDWYTLYFWQRMEPILR